MSSAELEAIISLLDDTDPNIIEKLEKKLIEIGPQVIDELEDAWSSTLDENHRQNIEQVIARIHEEYTNKAIQQWLKNDKSLIDGAILLAKVKYPEINAIELKAKVETIKDSIWLELNENLTSMERINTFNQVFFNEFNFSCDIEQTLSLNSNFIHLLLEKKNGSPIMIGILYLAIAQQLQLPLFGIDLPYYYCLAYCKYKRDHNNDLYAESERDVIFYINPSLKGLIFGKQEIQDYLERIEVENDSKYYQPISNLKSIYVLLKYLIVCFKHQNNEEAIEQYEKIKHLFDEYLEEKK